MGAAIPNSDGQMVTKTEMVSALSRSGYLMEQRLFPVLESAGFYVETNPVYPDPITGKAREYDFSAISCTRVYRDNYDYLWTAVVGECVNNSQPMVFFASDSPVDFLCPEDLKCAGIPLYFPDEDNREKYVSFQDFLHLDKFHHYCKGPFSTQYCTFVRKKGKNEWQASHIDEHHDAISSLVQASRHEFEHAFASWEPPRKGEIQAVNMTLLYPVLVLSGQLLKCAQSRGKPGLQPVDRIQFRQSCVVGKSRETYQINVMTESHFAAYLRILAREAEAIKKRLQRRKKEVRSAVSHMVSIARSIRKSKRQEEYPKIFVSSKQW